MLRFAQLKIEMSCGNPRCPRPYIVDKFDVVWRCLANLTKNEVDVPAECCDRGHDPNECLGNQRSTEEDDKGAGNHRRPSCRVRPALPTNGHKPPTDTLFTKLFGFAENGCGNHQELSFLELLTICDAKNETSLNALVLHFPRTATLFHFRSFTLFLQTPFA